MNAPSADAFRPAPIASPRRTRRRVGVPRLDGWPQDRRAGRGAGRTGDAADSTRRDRRASPAVEAVRRGGGVPGSSAASGGLLPTGPFPGPRDGPRGLDPARVSARGRPSVHRRPSAFTVSGRIIVPGHLPPWPHRFGRPHPQRPDRSGGSRTLDRAHIPGHRTDTLHGWFSRRRTGSKHAPGAHGTRGRTKTSLLPPPGDGPAIHVRVPGRDRFPREPHGPGASGRLQAPA